VNSEDLRVTDIIEHMGTLPQYFIVALLMNQNGGRGPQGAAEANGSVSDLGERRSLTLTLAEMKRVFSTFCATKGIQEESSVVKSFVETLLSYGLMSCVSGGRPAIRAAIEKASIRLEVESKHVLRAKNLHPSLRAELERATKA
jgi:hypothetical protein